MTIVKPNALLTLLCLLPLALSGCGKRGALIPPESLVPAPIKDLTAAQKGNYLQVSWSAPTKEEGGARLKDLAGFILFRHVVLPENLDCDQCPGAYREIARVDLDYLGQARKIDGRFYYDDNDLKSAETYRYKVRSRTAEGGESRDSNKAQRPVFTPPLPPVLEASATENAVDLSFVAIPPEQGKLTGYNIYRYKPGAPLPVAPLNPAPLNENTYQDKSLYLGERYSYTVRTVATMPDGETVESAPSNEVQGTLKEPD